MTYKLAHDNNYTKSSWKGVRKPDGTRTASVSCPVCGELISLSKHTIGDDGRVSPSLVCPYGCGFHEFIELEDWSA